MVKSVLGTARDGLRDWIIQRVSALIMAVYSLALIFYLLFHPQLSYADWQLLFSYTAIKVLTLLFIVAMLYHAWIGIWTVFTDYIKCFVVRSMLNVLVILSLIACFFWALAILWGV